MEYWLTTFMHIIRSAIIENELLSEAEQKQCNPENLSQMLKLAKQHNIAHLLAFGLKNNGISTLYKEIFEKEILIAVCRYEQLNYELKRLQDALEVAKIPFVFLKRSVIRQYYPESWLRTSCDIDVLVHECDIQRAIRLLKRNLEYCEASKTTHDVLLLSKGGIHIELHYSLIETGRIKSASHILERTWDTVIKCDGFEYQYKMPDEMFYFYHIAHMAKHIECGGCGIRPFIDILVLNHYSCVNKEKRNHLLEQGGLYIFNNNIELLSRIWFDNGIHTTTTLQLEQYILQGGVYGTFKNKISVAQAKRGGKFQYLISRIIIPYNLLKINYPIVQSHKWLIPVMEIKRWFDLLFKGRTNYAIKELKENLQMPDKSTENIQSFLKNVGL